MTLVVFDCDGTLVDSQHIIVAAMQAAFEGEGLVPLPRSVVLSIVGLSLPVAVARLLPEADAQRIARVVEAYKAAFTNLRRDPAHHEPMFPGAREMIVDLSSRPGVQLGIATGKSRRGLDAIVDRLELRHHFVTLQTADDNPSKPDPTMLRRAMAEADVGPAATVMIGDTTFDIEMARAAGAAAFGVTWGYHPGRDLERAGADAVVTSFEELAVCLRTAIAALGRAAQPEDHE